MKYLILLISIVTLSSCSNDVGRYQQMSGKEGILLDTKTGDVYWLIESGDADLRNENTYKWVKKVEFD
jgi:hypothetical protein